MDIPEYLRHTKIEYYRKKRKDEIDEESIRIRILRCLNKKINFSALVKFLKH